MECVVSSEFVNKLVKVAEEQGAPFDCYEGIFIKTLMLI